MANWSKIWPTNSDPAWKIKSSRHKQAGSRTSPAPFFALFVSLRVCARSFPAPFPLLSRPFSVPSCPFRFVYFPRLRACSSCAPSALSYLPSRVSHVSPPRVPSLSSHAPLQSLLSGLLPACRTPPSSSLFNLARFPGLSTFTPLTPLHASPHLSTPTPFHTPLCSA